MKNQMNITSMITNFFNINPNDPNKSIILKKIKIFFKNKIDIGEIKILKEFFYTKLCGEPTLNWKCNKPIDAVLNNKEDMPFNFLGKNLLLNFLNTPNCIDFNIPENLEIFKDIIELTLYPVISCIFQPQTYVKEYIELLNQKIFPNFAILKCNPDAKPDYTCGRAITINIEYGKTTRLIFFNTISDEDDSIDGVYYVNNIQPNLTGGYYHQKYLKYKKKYLSIKDSLDK
jgi:hypothetical protein